MLQHEENVDWLSSITRYTLYRQNTYHVLWKYRATTSTLLTQEDEAWSKISRHPHSIPDEHTAQPSPKPRTLRSNPDLLNSNFHSRKDQKLRRADSTQSLLLPGVPEEPEAKPQLELNCAAGSPANPGAQSHLAGSSSSAALAAGTVCQQGLSSAFHSALVCLTEWRKHCTLAYSFENNNTESIIPD